jgi:hypothetical protein
MMYDVVPVLIKALLLLVGFGTVIGALDAQAN